MESRNFDISFSIPEEHVLDSRLKRNSLFRDMMTATVLAGGVVWDKLTGGGTQAGYKRRSQTRVAQIYDRLYGLPNDEWVKQTTGSRYLLEYKGRLITADGWLRKKVFCQMLSQVLADLDAGSVLEVGSGRGNNIISLAIKNPNMRLTGLELSQSGVVDSRALLKNVPPVLNAVGAESGQLNLNNVCFQQGSALAMPFNDDTFDAAYTVLVLEQIPYEYGRVLTEMRRVTRRTCIFIEPFYEANNLRGLVNLKRRDYFRFSLRSFERLGLKPIYFFDDYPHKLKYKTGLLITQVMK